MATIIDVAKKAGVSTATVSRAFNGSGMVSESAMAAVMKAAKELGYVFTPRAHKDTPDKIIAVISPVLIPEIEEAIIDAALEENLSAIFLYSQGGESDELYLNGTLQLLEKQLKGVITVSSPSLFYSFKLKVPAGLPLVTTLEDPDDDRTYFVGSDNIRIGYDATQFLIDQGCKRIASIAAVNDRNNALKNIQGYKLALLDNGITPDPALCYEEDFIKRLSGEDPIAPLKAQIERSAPPDGVFCVIDLMADDLYDALKQMGLNVPEDVKVVCVGRTENHLRDRFAMARINNDYAAIGREAVRKLCSLAERGEESSSGYKTLVPHIMPE